jgi:large subunit ribosomal protein L22
MESSAKLRHLRIAPRKVRLVADLIRGKMALQSLAVLQHITKKAARPMAKLLQSAIVNAKNNLQLDENILYISKLTVDEGPKLKRWRPRAMGRAYPIQKKTSHITICLKERGKDDSKIKKSEVKNKKEK